MHTYTHNTNKLKKPIGLPDGSVVKNLPANAGDPGLTPIREDAPAGEQLGLCAQLPSLGCRAREPRPLSPHAATTEAQVP